MPSGVPVRGWWGKAEAAWMRRFAAYQRCSRAGQRVPNGPHARLRAALPTSREASASIRKVADKGRNHRQPQASKTA